MTDLEMMTTPMDWPKWPLLPLKHRTRGFHDEGFCGFLVAVETPPFTVYLGNIFAVALSGKQFGTACAELKTEYYASAAMLVADWKVD
jgi:hypothetical protein